MSETAIKTNAEIFHKCPSEIQAVYNASVEIQKIAHDEKLSVTEKLSSIEMIETFAKNQIKELKKSGRNFNWNQRK